MNNIQIKREKHFTTSVWILTKNKPQKLLLIHHKKLNKWLQPGGHIERFENPVDATIREAKEETGLDIGFLANSIEKVNAEENFLPQPAFFTEHVIPARNGNPKHVHLDISYIVEINQQKLHYNSNESHDIGWFTKKQALKLPIHASTKLILQKIMQPAA